MLQKELEYLLLGVRYNLGDRLWVCDFRYEDINQKPIRNVPPQEVALINNTQLPEGKKVYYSDFHFRALTKTGQVSAKVIAPYDNTGYRSFTGVSINIFKTEEECWNCYRRQAAEVLLQIDKAQAEQIKRFSDLRVQIESTL